MVLKRKRSDSEISSSSSLLTTSPLSSSSFMSIDNTQSQQKISSPSLFSSRTHKRHRDNRPSETDVHRMPPEFLPTSTSLTPSLEHTLSILYSAQQQPQQPQLHITPPPYPQQSPVSCLPSSGSSNGHQSNLHSFWALPSRRQSTPSSASSMISPMTIPTTNSFFPPANCEDCNTSLNLENNEDAMDVDVANTTEEPNHACTNCGKQVCHGCAVSNLGADRKCLMCAGKKWVGGLGWMRME